MLLGGVTSRMDLVAVNVVVAATVVVPMAETHAETHAGTLAEMESHSLQATIGSRFWRLQVRDANTGQLASLGHALVRDGRKLGTRWSIAHAPVFTITSSAYSSELAKTLTTASLVLESSEPSRIDSTMDAASDSR